MCKIELKNDCGDLKVNGIAYDGGKIDLPGWKFPVVVDLAGMMIPDSIPLLLSNNSGVNVFVGNTLPETKDNCLVFRGGHACIGKKAVRIICGLFNAVAGWDVHIGADVKECELVTKTREVNGRVFEGKFYHVQKSVLREIAISPIKDGKAEQKSNEKFTPGEWYLGNPFRHKDSRSEWRNVYADGEKNPIAVVLVNDGCGKTYHNAKLIAAAPDMYRMLERQCFLCKLKDHETECGICAINEVLKKARGE